MYKDKTRQELIKNIIDTAISIEGVYKTPQEDSKFKREGFVKLIEILTSNPDPQVQTFSIIFLISLFSSFGELDEEFKEMSFFLDNSFLSLLSIEDLCFFKRHLKSALYCIERDYSQERGIIDLLMIKKHIDTILYNSPDPAIKLYGLIE